MPFVCCGNLFYTQHDNIFPICTNPVGLGACLDTTASSDKFLLGYFFHNRVFKTGIPYNVLLTDITYLFYGDNKKCYLSTIKDAETNEILAYYISENMTLDILLESVKKLHYKTNVILNENVIIHSDQGAHYTSPKFHNLLKKYNIEQSMSRKGNCWDNAPQKSYF